MDVLSKIGVKDVRQMDSTNKSHDLVFWSVWTLPISMSLEFSSQKIASIHLSTYSTQQISMLD